MPSIITTWSNLRVCVCALLLAAIGCGDDLGQCDAMPAQELVYGRAGLVATKGQALMHDTCGNAAFCHSASASGKNRHGAPAGMNFDMLPVATGLSVVMNLRDDIWQQVVTGQMPPRGIGASVEGDGDFRFGLEGVGLTAKLPPLSTDQGKSALRNWLACGAPVVGKTSIPDWALPPKGDASVTITDFADVYANVLAPNCALSGCHGPGASAGGLAMPDACTAYRSLLSKGSCGKPRVMPGDGTSVLLDKLESNMPSCGSLRMPPPPYKPLDPGVLDGVRAWVEDGAAAEQCK